MARKKYSCDFETTTEQEDCRVWAYAYMEIGNVKNYKIGDSMDEFMEWLINVNSDVYFHNEKFDGSFIVSWLLNHGYRWSADGEPKTFNTLISSMGSWYLIDICSGYTSTKKPKKIHTCIYDSVKKLPFPVKTIANTFKLQLEKGEIDYHKYREIGYKIDDNEYKYIYNDVRIIADALEIQFKQGLTKMTNGSDSLNEFKKIIGSSAFKNNFPVLDLKVDANIRRAYRGGFTWVNDLYQGKDIGEGIVFDVNSLYPSVMYDKMLPYGFPVFYEGEYKINKHYPLYIQHVKCRFELKPKKIPVIQIKKNLLFKQNEYLKSSNGEVVDLYVSNVDLELIKEHYYLYNVEYVDGWMFKGSNVFFKDFIDKWNEVKENSEGGIRTLAKLIMNSLYGKFATNPDVTGKVPYLKEDGSLGFKHGGEEIRSPVYTAMGVFITSYARDYTIRTAQKCFKRIIYCDTDSIHLIGHDVPSVIEDIVDSKKIGMWKKEGIFYRGKFLRQKTYIEEYIVEPYYKIVGGKVIMTNIHFDVKCAGMPENIKKYVTFDNFKVGFKRNGKLVPKQVKGGVVLVDREFTIK